MKMKMNMKMSQLKMINLNKDKLLKKNKTH